MYGADGGWYLRYKPSGLLSGVLLTVFCAVNQAFFMGMFFLLAGYFTPGSFRHKGAKRFLLDRLVRLGLPTLVFGILIGPFSIAIADATADTTPLELVWRLIRGGTFNLGPLWFTYALLVFSAAYAALKSMLPRFSWQLRPHHLRHPAILGTLLAWGAGAFLLRLWVPTGQEFALLQIGYFSSYIILFIVGCAAAEHRLLEQVGEKVAWPWLVASALTIPSLLVYAALAGAFRGVPFELHGGWTWPVLFYAFWEPFVACGVILTLLWKCRVSRQPWAFWHRLAPLSYAAFIVHTPVVVAFGISLRFWQQHSLPMFALVGTFSLAVSFGLAAVLVRLPGARRIL
jgi:hypothetical protein